MLEMNSSFFYFSMAIGVAFGALGSYLCERKGRSRSMGFLLGFFFGFIGVVIVLFIPKATVSSSKDQDHSS